MGLFYCCCGTLLVLINVVYLIIGVAMVVIGILFNVGQSLVESFIKPLIEAELKKLGNSSIDVRNVSSYVLSNLTSISIALIIAGVILVSLSIIGMCSVCCKSEVTLIVYITILSVIVLVQLVALIIYVAKPDLVKEGITSILKAMIEKYVSFIATNTESFLINILGITLNCCGANNHIDFAAAPNFNKSLSGSFTYNGQTRGPYDGVILQYPIACCQFSNMDFVDADACIKELRANNKDVGCTNVIYNQIQSYVDTVFKIFGGIIGFEALLLLAAIVCLISLKDEAGVKPV